MKPFPDPSIKILHVLYDGECALCRRSCLWMERQAALVELRFISFQSPDILLRFPLLGNLDLGAELVAVSDRGDIYRGSQAWIMCLHALREYREWARRLSQPALLPLARRLCKLISGNRRGLSRWLLKATTVELQ